MGFHGLNLMGSIGFQKIFIGLSLELIVVTSYWMFIGFDWAWLENPHGPHWMFIN